MSACKRRPGYQPWTPEEEALGKAMRLRGESADAIADALGRKPSSVANKIRAERWPFVPAPREPVPAAPPPPPPRDPLEVEQERLEAARRIRQEREDMKAVAGEKSLRSLLESVMRDVVPAWPAPPPYRAPSVAPEKGVAESAILCLSDWHWGEHVDPERTRGFNAYSVEIATQRARRVFASARSILSKLQRGGWRWNRLVVSINGDMLTGTIHDLERHAEGRNIVQSTYECAMLLSELLRDFSTLAPRLDVFVTSGNHGRMAPKIEAKDPLRTWDAVMGLFVKTALAGIPSIRVEVPNSYACAYEVEGHTFVQTHGHQIRGGSFGGLPWYGINRMVTNYNALEASRGGRVTGWLLGHFHEASSLPNVSSEIFINGSLIGGNEYSIDGMGKNGRPCQWLLGVHPTTGISHRWPLFAESPVSSRATSAA